jgi:N-acetyl-anhydromuramyl-L-alanine amidase AmpD
MNNRSIDENAIIICLENLGCLKKNPISNTYTNWIGDIYKEDVYQKKWRECFFWQPYDILQIKRLSELILKLCEKYGIENKCIGTNVKIAGIENYNGIITRSNFDSDYKDVSPAFDFKLLKKLIGDE